MAICLSAFGTVPCTRLFRAPSIYPPDGNSNPDGTRPQPRLLPLRP